MRRSAAFFISALAMIVFASCSLPGLGAAKSDEKLEGQEIIEKAIRKYNDQQSGGYEAFDNITGKPSERFIYHYDEIGFLSFLCETYNDDGSVSREYNSGYAVYIEEDGIGSKLSKSDERFVVYNKEMSRYSKATGTVLGFIVDGVLRVDKTENKDGSAQYKYVYDPDEAGVSIEGGELSSYSIAYDVNASGDVCSFRQQAAGAYNSGESFEFDYTITLIPSDSVGLIENPITVTEEPQEAQQQAE